MPNPYLDECHQALPRLLSLFDRDPTSSTYGLGDRYYWGWKLIDFGNGTYQGAANGLARLMVNDLLPVGISKTAVARRINACFDGAAKLMRKNGSMEEAFPHESSFCVTALVAYDLLTAIELTDHECGELEIVRPMIEFLMRADEHHAFISNHLATAAAALQKWAALSGSDTGARANMFLERILDQQSEEGWFNEYGGADPGYQTLCMYYLADVLRMTPDNERLAGALNRSSEFLAHFVHPDGSFAGVYGSRHTRFFCPAGMEYMAASTSSAAAICEAMRASISRGSTITLGVFDEPNLVPFFNAYAWAATLAESSTSDYTLPCHCDPSETYFGEAGLYTRTTSVGYTVVSTKKGGVFHYVARDGSDVEIDCGLLAMNESGQYYTTQKVGGGEHVEVSEDSLSLSSAFYPLRSGPPSVFQFTVLRGLCLTLMRWGPSREWVKKALVRMLITGARPTRSRNRRVITWPEGRPIVEDQEELDKAENLRLVNPKGEFSSIHMASKGYWQLQDDA